MSGNKETIVIEHKDVSKQSKNNQSRIDAQNSKKAATSQVNATKKISNIQNKDLRKAEASVRKVNASTKKSNGASKFAAGKKPVDYKKDSKAIQDSLNYKKSDAKFSKKVSDYSLRNLNNEAKAKNLAKMSDKRRLEMAKKSAIISKVTNDKLNKNPEYWTTNEKGHMLLKSDAKESLFNARTEKANMIKAQTQDAVHLANVRKEISLKKKADAVSDRKKAKRDIAIRKTISKSSAALKHQKRVEATTKSTLASIGNKPGSEVEKNLLNKNVKDQERITEELRNQKKYSRAVQGNTTRLAMNFLSIMFMGQAITKTFKGLYKSGISAFQELTKGTDNTNKGISMLQANVKFVQFSLGAAIGDALMPAMDSIANFAEWLSDLISKHPKGVMAFIFLGVAIGTIMSITGQIWLLGASLKNIVGSAKAGKVMSDVSKGINDVDTIKLNKIDNFIGKLSNFQKGVVGVVGLTLAIASNVKVLTTQSDVKDYIINGLTTVVGGTLAAVMAASILGVEAAAATVAPIAAPILLAIAAGVASVDYAKETGMTRQDFMTELGKTFSKFLNIKANIPIVMMGNVATAIIPMAVTYNVGISFIRAGKDAQKRREDFLTSQVGQEKQVEFYNAVKEIQVNESLSRGYAPGQLVGLGAVRDKINKQLADMQGTGDSSMFDLFGFGKKISNKEIDQLQARMQEITKLQLFQDQSAQQAQNVAAGAQAGNAVGESYANGFNNGLNSSTTTTVTNFIKKINPVNDSLSTLNSNMSTTKTLSEESKTKLANTADEYDRLNSSVRGAADAQAYYNRTLNGSVETETSNGDTTNNNNNNWTNTSHAWNQVSVNDTNSYTP